MNHASRWSAIGLPGSKTVLDEGRLSHGSVYGPRGILPRGQGTLGGLAELVIADRRAEAQPGARHGYRYLIFVLNAYPWEQLPGRRLSSRDSQTDRN